MARAQKQQSSESQGEETGVVGGLEQGAIKPRSIKYFRLTEQRALCGNMQETYAKKSPGGDPFISHGQRCDLIEENPNGVYVEINGRKFQVMNSMIAFLEYE